MFVASIPPQSEPPRHGLKVVPGLHEHTLPDEVISEAPTHKPTLIVYPFEIPVYVPLVRKAVATAVATDESVKVIPVGSTDP